ncbi:hypothetical protein FN846DRAFT_977459 [Sphaerosporella brunnea]|uniref:Rhodopsin domain-containing protein n=1 Tax=Sphaerosporella brunnea TaxID=1250544 RepID=A0A5J5EDR7_9PEZI|nr:hypothetical protein FN846DRAFT_977459 [Sphaerosporella brunnea]
MIPEHQLKLLVQREAINVTDTAALPHNNMVGLTRGVLGLMAGLSLSVCGSRLYVRIFIVKNFGLDDVMVIIALIMCLGFALLGFFISENGSGRHLWDVPPEQVAVWFKCYYAAVSSYIYVAFFVKTSLLVFLMRIFPGKRLQRNAKYMIAFLVAFTISSEMATTFSCDPVQAGWDKTIKDAKCWSAYKLWCFVIYEGVIMSLSDVAIMLLPMWDLWELKLPYRKKMELMVMFGLGLIATVISIVRLSTNIAGTKDTTDFTYTSCGGLIMMNVEFHTGLITGSLPSLRLLPGIRRLFSRSGRSATGYSGKINDTGPQAGSGNGLRSTEVKMSKLSKAKSPYGNLDITLVAAEPEHEERESGSRTTSQERIIENGAGPGANRW